MKVSELIDHLRKKFIKAQVIIEYETISEMQSGKTEVVEVTGCKEGDLDYCKVRITDPSHAERIRAFERKLPPVR